MMKFLSCAIVSLLLLAGCKNFTVTDKAPGSGAPASSILFPGLQSIDNISGTSLRLNWSHVSGAANYIVYNMSSGSPVLVATVAAPTATYDVSGIAPSTLHKYRVRLLDSQGLFDTNTNDVSATTLAVTATFNGWTHIVAKGPKVPAAQASGMAAAGAAVTITWPAVTLSSSVVASYNIYRATSSGGQDFNAPLGAGIATTSRSYTDSTVVAGTTYYYKIAPVLSSSTVIQPTAAADLELKVIVPQDNMVLLHRWAANIEMCGEMGKAVDRNNNYRCTVAIGATAPPGTGGTGILDLGASLFVDMFEQGCNYTYSSTVNKCGTASGCIGILDSPHGVVTGDDGNIYYSRRSGHCYINTSGGTGTSWTSAINASAPQRQLMGSPMPGLPPMVLVSQPASQNVCSGQGASGFPGTKRLLKRREQVLLGAWSSSLTDAEIEPLENGTNLDTTFRCNANFASPQGNNTNDISGTNASMAFDNNAVPTAIETLPGCLHGDCSGSGANSRALRTGSNATINCVSRYGAQDVVGNVWEYASDQMVCNGASCTGTAGAANPIDNTNDDFSGVAFDGTQGGLTSQLFTTYGKIQFPIGIPIAGGAFAGDGTMTRTAAQFRGDYYWFDVNASSSRGVLSGGSWYDTYASGRFSLFAAYEPSAQWINFGLRCALAAE